MLNAQLTNSLKKTGFFGRIIDPNGETETSSYNQNKEIALQISRNKQYYNHLSPNRNFRLYQEGCLGFQSERSKFKSQEYAITIKGEAVKRLSTLVEAFGKVIMQAELHWNMLERFTQLHKYRIDEDNERRRQLAKIRRGEASLKGKDVATSLPFPL